MLKEGMMYVIKEEELLEKLKKEIEFTEYLQYIPNIEKMMVKQAEKESSLFVYATRYEKAPNDMSVGLFQLLTTTIQWLGFKGSIEEMFDISTQIRYAVKYMDWLYSRFPEIKSVKERFRVAVAAYNCGIGNINKGVKFGLQEEEIHYEGSNTIQGYWATYDRINQMMVKYKRISEKNGEINKRYVEYITGGLV